MSIAAIVAAAGRGLRLGPGGPKALQLLAGEPMLVHAVRALAAARDVDLVVVAAPPDRLEEIRSLLREHHTGAELDVVAGGETRSASVRRALSALPEGTTAVLVHDAARPLAPVHLIEAVAAAVVGGADAVVPGVPVADTLKEVADGKVTGTLDRSRMCAAQTPQGFRREVLERAHAEHDPTGSVATDDSSMVERLGLPVLVVPGDEEAFKVTRPLDLLLAEAVLERRRSSDGG